MPNAFIIPLLIAAAMPYLFTGIAKWGAFGRRDNARTREWQAGLQGWRKRAHWAHQNSFEAFPIFAVAVLVVASRAPSNLALAISWTFIGLRLAYGACWIWDKPSLRSLVWFAALACPVTLFVLALFAD